MNFKSREKLLASVAALSLLGISPQQTFAAQRIHPGPDHQSACPAPAGAGADGAVHLPRSAGGAKEPSDWHHPRCSGLRVQGTAISPAAHCLVYGISEGMSRNL